MLITAIAKNECISDDSTFFWRTIPPYKSARPGVISSTSAVATIIQAVLPASTEGMWRPRASPDAARREGSRAASAKLRRAHREEHGVKQRRNGDQQPEDVYVQPSHAPPAGP